MPSRFLEHAPETVDELMLTVRELIETAKRAEGRRSILTDYVVSVQGASKYGGMPALAAAGG